MHNLSLVIITMTLEQKNQNMKSTKKQKIIFTDNQNSWMEKWVVCFVFPQKLNYISREKKLKAKIFKPEREILFHILMLK